MRSAIHAIDYVVLVGYLCLMAGVGAYFMRYMRGGTDFLKGGNRIEWWVAGMASFMSGFSVWTFTGGAGFAYRNGVIVVSAFFGKLATPIDPATELGESGMSGRGQLAIVGKVTTGIGLACFLMLLANSSGRELMITAAYAAVTTAVGLAFVVAGRTPQGGRGAAATAGAGG